MKWYVKERYNPQLGTYYRWQGQLSKSEAMEREKPLYGENYLHGFDTEKEARDYMAEMRKENNK